MRIFFNNSETPFKELVRLMHEHRVSALPVIDPNGVVLGIVSEGDLLLKEDADFREEVHVFERREHRIEHRKATALLARDLMTAPAVTIGPGASAAQAAHVMHHERVRRLPVVDRTGRLLGMVSRVDLLGTYLRSDDGIAAEIRNEILGDEFFLPPHAIRVEVHEGVVNLEGTVDRRSLIEDLVSRVRRVDGVVGVESRIGWDVDDITPVYPPIAWVGI